ncbi:hypothetical protein L21SP2_0469 [Salinispira pacifica]|uniref:PDZ domain-containing protein n=2 Tax=Salinispira pacifica TaxID=1307761 RepID=V5WFE2_9SPIO|nr:hypothetical protein L21SP2_0469 [Salinispira pacifica]
MFALIPAALFANGNQEAGQYSQAWGPGYRAEVPVADGWHGRGMGIHVLEVLQESAADAAGLQAGDVIIAVNGEYIYEVLSDGTLADLNAGEMLTLNVMRFREDDSQYMMPEELIIDLEVGQGANGEPRIGISYSIPGGMYGRGPAGHGMMGARRNGNPGGRGYARGLNDPSAQSF